MNGETYSQAERDPGRWSHAEPEPEAELPDPDDNYYDPGEPVPRPRVIVTALPSLLKAPAACPPPLTPEEALKRGRERRSVQGFC